MKTDFEGELKARNQQGVKAFRHGQELIPWLRRSINFGAIDISLTKKGWQRPAKDAPGQVLFRNSACLGNSLCCNLFAGEGKAVPLLGGIGASLIGKVGRGRVG